MCFKINNYIRIKLTIYNKKKKFSVFKIINKYIKLKKKIIGKGKSKKKIEKK